MKTVYILIEKYNPPDGEITTPLCAFESSVMAHSMAMTMNALVNEFLEQHEAVEAGRKEAKAALVKELGRVSGSLNVASGEPAWSHYEVLSLEYRERS